MKRLLPVAFLICINLSTTAQNAQEGKSHSKFSGSNPQNEIIDLISKGRRAGDKDTALASKFFREAIQKAKTINNKFLEGNACYASAKMHFSKQAYHKAFGQFLYARNAYFDGGYPNETARSTLDIANSQYYRGNFRAAITRYVEAMSLAEELQNELLLQEATENLGLLYNAFQNFGQSINYFRKSLLIKQSLNDEKGALRITEKLGDLYFKNRQFDSAYYFANLSALHADDLGLKPDAYLSRFTKVATLVRLGRWDDAETELLYFEKNPIIGPNVNFKTRYHTMLGDYWLFRNEIAKSKLHYDSALDIASRTSFPELLGLVYQSMSESYYVLKDYEKAYEYSQKYYGSIALQYSGDNAIGLGNIEGLQTQALSNDEIRFLNNENKLKHLELLRAAEMRANLERENFLMDTLLKNEKMLSEALKRSNVLHTTKLENEQKLGLALARENDLQVAKLKNARTLRLTLLVGLSMAVLLAGVIFYQYRRQRNKNAIIQRQAEDLQTLMKEIHHRVKNNLQVISSLLDLQSFSIADDKVAEAVREGKNRVQSMALIHQNLYSEGNIKGIRMNVYINNLAQSLFDSYNIGKNKVTLVTDIDDLNLDVDTVIPIGLIINELVSNSLKYAFRDREDGQLEISLKRREDELHLNVRDNGQGFDSTGLANIAETSFGYKLIRAFARKLKARLDVFNHGGACISMKITKFKMA